MKSFLLIIYALALIASPKLITKTIKLANFHKEGPFVFLTKFHIGSGHGRIDIKYTKGDQIVSQPLYNNFSIGAINSSALSKFLNTSKCEQKEKLLYSKDRFNLRQQKHGMKRLSLYNLTHQQLWYFYVFSCFGSKEPINTKEQIAFQVSILNNDSHFGQNEQTLLGYFIIIIVWAVLMVRFSFPLMDLLSLRQPSGSKLAVFGGLILLGTAYLYRLIHLALYKLDGSGIYVFELFYIVLKNAGEAIITTMIVSLSWGWSIIHLNSSQNYMIIGFIVGIINIVSIILSVLTEEHEQLFHQYETVPGMVILISRMLIFIAFTCGIASCLKSSSGATTFFIRKFAIIGGSYLLSWPLTVLVVQCALPNYMHKEIITFVEQAVHICTCTLLCSMISSPQSAYRRVSLHQEDNPLEMKNYRHN